MIEVFTQTDVSQYSMKKIAAIFLVFLLFISCLEKKENIEEIESKLETKSVIPETKELKKFESSIKLDTSLTKQKLDITLLQFKAKSDTLVSFCNCEKNVKNNALKIQLRTSFPPESLLKKGQKKWLIPPIVATDSMPIQYRFLTFHLKDSIMEKAEILKISTENQFNGQNKDQQSVNHYKLTINRFDYEIADRVWGEYEVRLPSDFGYTKNDTIVKGTFHCNNWIVVKYDDLDSFIKPVNHIE